VQERSRGRGRQDKYTQAGCMHATPLVRCLPHENRSCVHVTFSRQWCGDVGRLCLPVIRRVVYGVPRRTFLSPGLWKIATVCKIHRRYAPIYGGVRFFSLWRESGTTFFRRKLCNHLMMQTLSDFDGIAWLETWRFMFFPPPAGSSYTRGTFRPHVIFWLWGYRSK